MRSAPRSWCDTYSCAFPEVRRRGIEAQSDIAALDKRCPVRVHITVNEQRWRHLLEIMRPAVVPHQRKVFAEGTAVAMVDGWKRCRDLWPATNWHKHLDAQDCIPAKSRET